MTKEQNSRLVPLVDRFHYKWRIEDFSKIPSTNGKRYDTDYFLLDNDATMTAFRLDIYAGGDKPEHDKFVSFHVHGVVDQEEDAVRKSVSIDVTVVFSTSSDKELCRRTMIYTLEPGVDYGWHRFIGREFLLSQIPDGILHVSFEVYYVATLVPDGTGEDVHVSESCYNKDSTEDFLSALAADRNSDLTIRVGGRDLPAHKFVLASRSNVFAAMFEHGAMDSATKTIEVTDFDFDTVVHMLCFTYRWRVPNMDVDIALELLRAADKYNMGDLKRFSINFLLADIDGQNIGKILVAADVHQATELRKAAVDFLCKNLSVRFHRHRSFLKERPELLCEIISHMAEILKSPKNLP